MIHDFKAFHTASNKLWMMRGNTKVNIIKPCCVFGIGKNLFELQFFRIDLTHLWSVIKINRAVVSISILYIFVGSNVFIAFLEPFFLWFVCFLYGKLTVCYFIEYYVDKLRWHVEYIHKHNMQELLLKNNILTIILTNCWWHKSFNLSLTVIVR